MGGGLRRLLRWEVGERLSSEIPGIMESLGLEAWEVEETTEGTTGELEEERLG